MKSLFICSNFTRPALHILESRLLPSHVYLIAGESWEQPLIGAGISQSSKAFLDIAPGKQSKT